jgi:hypothetical protein
VRPEFGPHQKAQCRPRAGRRPGINLHIQGVHLLVEAAQVIKDHIFYILAHAEHNRTPSRLWQAAAEYAVCAHLRGLKYRPIPPHLVHLSYAAACI